MKGYLVRYKVGPDIRYGIKSGAWIFPYDLTKAERKVEANTGWPRKLPDVYPGPRWPEEG